MDRFRPEPERLSDRRTDTARDLVPLGAIGQSDADHEKFVTTETTDPILGADRPPDPVGDDTARSAARHVDSPSDVLLRIHEALQTYDGTNYCTVCFAVLEQRHDRITVHVALGGHPHPLLRRHDGQVEPLGHAGTLLGLVPPHTHTTHTQLFPGDVLVLYTDGVTDAPGELAVTVEEFADTISRAGPGPAAIATAIGNLLDTRRPNGGSDDTALLIIEITQHHAATTSPTVRESGPLPETPPAPPAAQRVLTAPSRRSVDRAGA